MQIWDRVKLRSSLPFSPRLAIDVTRRARHVPRRPCSAGKPMQMLTLAIVMAQVSSEGAIARRKPKPDRQFTPSNTRDQDGTWPAAARRMLTCKYTTRVQ